MSFFPEVEEPRPSPRREPSRRRTPATARRRASHQRAIRRRRLIALVATGVAILLLAVLVNSCQASQRDSALKDYNANVAAVIGESQSTSQQFFSVLTSGAGAHSLYTSLNQARDSAGGQLGQARSFAVPDGLQSAQERLLLALRMRRDAIGGVAENIQPALGRRTTRDAVTAIAADMAQLYASDVIYKSYALPQIVGALRADDIAVGGANGQQIRGDQFLPDLRWLNPTFVASQLHVNTVLNRGRKKIAPGDHGHGLDSVSAAGTPLQSGSANSLPASPAPTFTLQFTNLGQNPETNVVCKATLAPSSGGTGYVGQSRVARTTAGETTTCTVPVHGSPPAGSYTLTATIEPVPGESDKANNTQTFPVTLR